MECIHMAGARIRHDDIFLGFEAPPDVSLTCEGGTDAPSGLFMHTR